MIAVDTNILVYGHRPDLPFHPAAVRCLTGLAEGPSVWGIPWSCAHEFLSVVTNPRVFRIATPAVQALAFLDALRGSGRCVMLAEGKAHWENLSALVASAEVRAGQVHDARIVAVCLSHGVREFLSADRDFSRYPALRVRNPLG